MISAGAIRRLRSISALIVGLAPSSATHCLAVASQARPGEINVALATNGATIQADS